MKRKLNPYWVFSLVIKILVPVIFVVIATLESIDWANALAGTTLILTLASYVLGWLEVDQNKYMN